MSLLALIRKGGLAKAATETTATIATQGGENGGTVATVATVAVARPTSPEVEPLPDAAAETRRQRVLAMLAGEPALRNAAVCDGEGDPVPVAIAIRDKGTCELRIPRAKFDAFLLLDLVERYGGSIH